MSKYIDAEKLIEHLEFINSGSPVWGEMVNAAIKAFEKIIEYQPEAIVRCKDCKYAEHDIEQEEVVFCCCMGSVLRTHDFCSRGKRNEE